ncbi:MAG TPA: AMP-binding protein, partial [Pyrinomonadaceae bacterium]|nr:AMP-binding protein [Pyrinomonadaceae bacterium]
CAVLIEGSLRLEVLQAAINKAVKRHEILRTTFRCLPGMTSPLQIINEGGGLLIHAVNMNACTAREETEITQLLLDEAQELPFDFEQGPLMFVQVATLASGKHLLIVHLSALCADEVGLRNLLHDISRCYEASVNGEELPDEPLQYADLSAALNDLLKSEETEAGREYWRRPDFRNSFVPALPFAHTPLSHFHPATFSLRIAPQTHHDLMSLAHRHQTSLAILLLACWHILLWRMTSHTPLRVAAWCDGRSGNGLADALGLFAKYLPVDCRLEAGEPLPDVLKRVAETVADIERWQDYFSWEHFADPAEDAGQQYFPFGFACESGAVQRWQAGEVEFRVERLRLCFERFNLKLNCVETEDALATEWLYDNRVYGSPEIERLASGYGRLLESVAQTPQALISDLAFIGEQERTQILFEWNDKALSVPKRCLHQLFAEQVARTPDAVAVVFRDESLTYRETNERANRLARFLRRHAARPEAIVAILMERSTEMLIALLAVLKAGAAYLPLDPAYPCARLRFMLEDAGVALTLSSRELWERINAGGKVLEQGRGVELICLDEVLEEVERESSAAFDDGTETANIAYVIYTSGSTGRPKAVMVEHLSIVNRLLWMQESLPLTSADRVLQRTSLSFDASIWELFVPLLCGARLVLADSQAQQDIAQLAQTITRFQVSILQLVPSMLRVWMEEPSALQC